MGILWLISAAFVAIFLLLLIPFKGNVINKCFGKWLEQKMNLLSSIASIIAIVSFPIIIIGGYIAYKQLQEQLEKVQLYLHFRNPKQVAFSIINPSGKVAQDIMYQFALLDLSKIEDGLAHQFLIPNKKIEYILANSWAGPNALLDLASQKISNTDNDVIFGIASIWCKNCETRTNYWVYLEKKKYGWYAEVLPEEEQNAMLLMTLALREGEKCNARILSQITENRRIP